MSTLLQKKAHRKYLLIIVFDFLNDYQFPQAFCLFLAIYGKAQPQLQLSWAELALMLNNTPHPPTHPGK